jgi:pentatricopeptide repeat protein
MYGRCGGLEDARDVFDVMLERNTISWNAMIGAYAKNGDGQEALVLASRMHQELLPDDVTWVTLLEACASLRALTDGKKVHCCTVSGKSKSNIILGNALVHMYGRCGRLYDASKVFDDMNVHNETSWNALISIFVSNGQTLKAVNFFCQMMQEGAIANKITFVTVLSACASDQHPLLTPGKHLHASAIACEFELDVVVGTALVNMYGNFLCLNQAVEIFYQMPEHNMVCFTAMISAFSQNGEADNAIALFNLIDDKCDAILWNSVISACVQNGQGKRALTIFEQMLQEGIMPDRVTFIGNLDACATEAVLGEAKRMHSRVVCNACESDDVIQNTLVNMYGRCGSLEIAWRLFKRLRKRDVFSWSSLIAAYAQIGEGKAALHTFKRMTQEGITPDKVTFVNVLSACSHAGLIQEGCQYFASMEGYYGITPMIDHYNCMIDLLGRSGQLEEAEALIINMKVQASTASWFTMLSACRNNLDVRRGEWAAESLFKLQPDNATPYIMLANIYTAVGQTSDAEDVLNRMRGKGLMLDNQGSILQG